MRIIGGKYRGRTIDISRNFKARPTTDFARESLFNILNNYLDFDNVKVLDLFAGTGSISFEFASRGCTDIDLVELDHGYLQAINSMEDKLGIKVIRAIRADAYRYFESCKKKYDLVFADPPFVQKEIERLPDLVFDSDILNSGGRFVLEHSKDYSFSDHPNFSEHRKYGHVHFSFFRVPHV